MFLLCCRRVRNFGRKHRELWKYQFRYKPILTFQSTEAVFLLTPTIQFLRRFFPKSQMTRHQTKCGKHDAVCMTLPPSSSSTQGHVRVPYPLCCGELLCHSLSCIVFFLPRSQYVLCAFYSAASHYTTPSVRVCHTPSTRAPSRFLAIPN